MRVTPLSQYQLVDQDPYPHLQLALRKNRFVRRCASFVCFGRASARTDKSSYLKVGPTQNQKILPEAVDFYEKKDQVESIDMVGYDESIRTLDTLKSSLKKSANTASVARMYDGRNSKGCEEDKGIARQMESKLPPAVQGLESFLRY